MVTIRLARGGRARKPVFTIVAADSRCSRDGRFLDRLGQYNPGLSQGKELSNIKTELIKAWVGKGATVSDTVRSLLKRNQIQL